MYYLKNYLISKYFIIFYLLGIYILAIINNIGFYNDDEHFQILEPVAYLLGLNDFLIDDRSGLYWEWHSSHRVRPWLQPNLYYLIILLLKNFGLNDPFIWNQSIRFFNGILGIGSVLYLFYSLKDYFFKNNTLYIYILFFSFWFFPFLHTRTSSESLSIILFCFAFAFLLKFFDKSEINYNKGICIFFGFILGLSIVVRPQMLFTIIPIFLWIILYRFDFNKIFLVSVGFLLSISFGLYVDYLNWGFVTNTYLQIYNLQINQGRLSSFGSDPWWFYIVTILKDLAPIFSLFFIISLFFYFYKNPKSIFTTMIIGTFLILILFQHKETRFIFPIYFFAPFFLIYFFEYIKIKILKNIFIFTTILFNLLFLLIVIFFPLNGKVSLYKFLYYQNYKYNNIYYFGENPYQFNEMEPLFYTTFLPKISVGKNIDNSQNSLLITNDFHTQIKIQQNEKCNLVYSTYPLKFINLNKNWKKRGINWYVNQCKNKD